jgi:hypothetical protein
MPGQVFLLLIICLYLIYIQPYPRSITFTPYLEDRILENKYWKTNIGKRILKNKHMKTNIGEQI